jgi:hypothetical protein
MGPVEGVSASATSVIAGGVITGCSSWAKAQLRLIMPDNMIQMRVIAMVFMAAPFK